MSLKHHIAAVALCAVSLVAGQAKADYRIINQSSNDTTLLRAYVTSQKISDVLPARDATACPLVFRDQYGNSTYNCKDEISRRLGVPFVTRNGYVHINYEGNGNFYFTDNDGDTPIVYIETATRESAYQNSGAYGIYWDMGGYPLIIGKDQMREVARVPLRDGSQGIVHRFAVPFEQTGGGNNGPIRYICFKPFIDFHVPAEGVLYRNWDVSPGIGWWTNYWLGKGYQPYREDHLSIERSAEVLAR